MTFEQYTPILTLASYVHAKQAMPYTLQMISSLPFVNVQTTTGTIIRPNIAEQRRNDVVAETFGEKIKTRKSDTTTSAYTTAPYVDGEEILGVEIKNVGGLTSETVQSHMMNIATVTAERVLIKLLKGFANEFMDAANYGSGSKTDPTNWTVSTTDLVKQITDKVVNVQKESGALPDTIIVTRDVHQVIRYNVNVLDGLAGFGASTAQEAGLGNYELDLARFAALFGVANYFVLDASYNAAGLRATASNSWLETNKLLIACMGQNLSLNGSAIENYTGLGVCPYVTDPDAFQGDFKIGNGVNALPFPIQTRTSFDADTAGYGNQKVFSEAVAGFQLLNDVYGHLFYGAIA